MRICVTGAAGLLGREVCAAAERAGHSVTGLDVKGADRIAAVDVRNAGELRDRLDGCDAVVHLAAHPSLYNKEPWQVHNDNVTGSYNVLWAAADAGLSHVCLASSVNAIGGKFSKNPRYDHFPLDEEHPSYCEDPYSLSKHLAEEQAAAVSRAHAKIAVSSLRFHRLVPDRPTAIEKISGNIADARRDLWGYTCLGSAAAAVLASLQVPWTGHEVFYIVAPRTASNRPSSELARRWYPEVSFDADVLGGDTGFFDCAKAARLLGWRHE
jgi:nucleoside-diphosphate-sugar epimerase